MDKTKVDDMLIEMISPKVKEIEEKFTSNQGLTQDDINTLLLKSQYNHINHLDKKLDEVTADVSSLKGDFSLLRSEVTADTNSLRGDFKLFKNKVTTDISELRSDMDLFKNEVKSDISELRSDFALLKSDIEATIQKALNKNMMLLVTAMGGFMILSKIIDKF